MTCFPHALEICDFVRLQIFVYTLIFLMKMFRTVNMDVINECRFYFDFMLPSELLVKRKSNFLRKFNTCCNIVCHFGFAKCVKRVWQLFIFY